MNDASLKQHGRTNHPGRDERWYIPAAEIDKFNK